MSSALHQLAYTFSAQAQVGLPTHHHESGSLEFEAFRLFLIKPINAFTQSFRQCQVDLLILVHRERTLNANFDCELRKRTPTAVPTGSGHLIEFSNNYANGRIFGEDSLLKIV